jgi:hypothetical protein
LVERILGKDEVSSSNLDSSSSSEHPEAIKASGCFFVCSGRLGQWGQTHHRDILAGIHGR